MRILFILLIGGFLISCNNNSDCTNGVQDGNETGVDCGGNCPPCQPNNPNPPSNGIVTDNDGNTYQTVVIGSQEWMAENLRTTTYANGDPITNITDQTEWQNTTGTEEGAWCHYNNDSQFEIPYGKLYNWYAIDDARNVCPTGWHVPIDEEWDILVAELGGSLVAGGKMKSTGTQYWISPNTDATNESGFSGLPGGVRQENGVFNFIGTNGLWWNGDANSGASANYHYLNYMSGQDSQSFHWYAHGMSVRCVKD